MAGVLRRLVTEVVLKSADAVKGLKAYDALWKAVAKSVDASASAIEKSADRAAAAMGRVASGAASVRGMAGGSRGSAGGSGGRRAGADPIGAATARANRSEAAKAGLDAGARRITEATAALGTFAKASDRARAKVADLSAQVERNRREMAELRKKTLETGDADGTLTARMRGLAAATGIASRDLAVARKELRGFEGGLIQAVKQATLAKVTVTALGTAIGNAMTGAARSVAGGIVGVLGESAGKAMTFEKSLVDIQKVARGADDTAEGMAKIRDGIKAASKDLGVMPEQVADLAAQITPVFSGKEDIVALTADVTKIGVAWDISGKEAGKFFADTSRGMQMTAAETKELFGGINELSNQLGVKAADIAEAFTRSAGVIKASGLSPETGAALNATLIAAGATAEVAATGVRTFVTRLEAGEAASAKQIEAFKKLGLNAKDVAHQMAQGGKTAEDQIQAVVKAIGGLDKENQISTLMQLFGSESLGSIGAAATAAENLGKAFGIASGESAGFNSVLKEYDRVSNTTAAKVEKLKASISVLAIELGEALLPYINQVVEFLTSPEGQEWGRSAVETAKEAVVGLASAVQSLAAFFAFLIDNIGGVGTAVGALGLAVAGLAGPWGIAAAAAVAAVSIMLKGLGDVLGEIGLVNDAVMGIGAAIAAVKGKELADKVRADEDDAMAGRNTPVPGGGVAYGYQPSAAAAANAAPSAADPAAKLARFNALVGTRNKRKLNPSEVKELKALSKSLDLAIPDKPGKGHKATKMDRQLAAMDPALAGLLRQGGDEDAGGDLKVHDDVLSKGAFKAANSAGGLGGISGSGGVGPGPNINTTNIFNDIKVMQNIDARSTGSAADNIRGAAYEAGTQAAGVIVTGIDRARAMKQGGGRMA